MTNDQVEDSRDASGRDEAAVERTMVLRVLSARHPSPMAIGHYVVFIESGLLRRVMVPPEGIVIGRVAPCDVIIADAAVSRRHCRVDLDGGRAVISDLGSTNGTMVGGRRISRPARLHNGDAVSLGSFTLRYERRDLREVEQEGELAAELRGAVEYVRAILPAPIPTGLVQTEWWFVPSLQLGGDAFGYQFLDETCFTGFVLDVSGHGMRPAMHAVSVANVLRRRALPGVDFRDPAQVAAGLNAMSPMEEHDGLLLTLWYFAYDLPSRTLRFCAAGHHPSFIVSPRAPDPAPLWRRSPMIGMLPRGTWEAGRFEVPEGSRLYMFSDGAFEIVARSGEPWVLDDLRRIMTEPEQPGIAEPQRLYEAVRAAARPGPLADDFSVLVVRFA